MFAIPVTFVNLLTTRHLRRATLPALPCPGAYPCLDALGKEVGLLSWNLIPAGRLYKNGHGWEVQDAV